MNLDQSIGQYLRLKQELGRAYSTLPWNNGRLNRLTVDLQVDQAAPAHQAFPGQQRERREDVGLVRRGHLRAHLHRQEGASP